MRSTLYEFKEIIHGLEITYRRLSPESPIWEVNAPFRCTPFLNLAEARNYVLSYLDPVHVAAHKRWLREEKT